MSDLVRRLRGDGEVAATGQLSLDREEARTKLQRFRLPDPHMYVLQLVKAASVLGATKIEFTIGPSTTVCVFDAVFAHGAFDDLWSAAFEERTTAESAAIHNLALGLSSAQALNPEFIEVESGGEKLLIRDGEETVLFGDAPDHTNVVVKEKFRLGHLVEFFAMYLDELPEIRAVMRACEFSLMTVICNGGRVNHIWMSSRVELQDAADGPIATVVQRGFQGTKYVLLRDDVLAGSMSGPAVIMPGRAAQNSRTAPMDLTGLGLRERPASFPRDVRSAYHRRLLYWLDRNQSPAEHQRYQLEELCRELADSDLREMGDGSRQLLTRLLDAPIFESSLGTGELVPLRRADGVIEVSRAVFPLATTHTGSVALIEAHPDLAKMLAELGVDARDVTGPLRDLERQARNRARFEAQPVWFERATRSTPTSLIAEFGDLWGRVTVQQERPQARGRVFVDGRLLFKRETALPFDLEVDGPLRPTPFYDNVVRDDAYDRLALELVVAARKLFSRVTDRTRGLALLTSIARREFETELLRVIGYSRNEARLLLSDQPAPGDDDEYRWLIREAQTLSWLPLFQDPQGNRHSLRAIIDEGKPPLFSKQASAAQTTDRLVLNPTPQQRRLLKFLWPEAQDLETARLRETARDRFLRQPIFTTPETPKALFRHRVSGDDLTLDLDLLGGGTEEGARAEVYVVLEERLVARHRWSAPLGYWRVTVRGELLHPLNTYEDVRRDDEFWKLTTRFGAAVFEALAAWRRHVVREGSIDAEGIELFVHSSLRHDEVSEMRLLAWKVDGARYSTVLPTLQQLADAVEPHGMLRYAHPDEVYRLQGQPDGLVLMLPRSIPENDLRLGPLASCGFRHLPPPRLRARSPVERPTTLGDGLIHFVDTVGGFEVASELVETVGEPIHTIELIHNDRVIERIEQADVASFRSLVRGAELTPDPTFSSMVSGRNDAIDAAIINARKLIEEGCTSLDRFGSEPLRATLRALAMTQGHEQESWWETLARAPLLETPSGFESFTDRARRFAAMDARQDSLREVADLLRVARGNQTDLLHDFTLASIQWSDAQDRLCVVDVGEVMVLRTHPLVAQVVGGDEIAARFLASCIATEINAYYAQITDTDELELQHRLLRVNL